MAAVRRRYVEGDDEYWPGARNTDPQTSHGAAASIRPRAQHIAVLRATDRANGPLIPEEIADLNGWTKETCCYWKRISECEQAGWLEAKGVKRAIGTGRNQRAMVITDFGRRYLYAQSPTH